MLTLFARSLEFAFYHCFLALVDRISRLPRATMLPEAARLYRENIALKAQLDALERHIRVTGPKTTKRPLGVRAAQVFAYLLTRGDEPFQRYFLSAPITTIKRWATKFRRVHERPVPSGGRPELAPEIVDLIVTFKMENRTWGQRRIREELRRMGIRVSEPTIKKVLLGHGFSPNRGRKLDFARFRSTAKDAVWALDFFVVKTAANTWMQVLLILDIYTRERIAFRVHDGWDVESRWTARVFNEVLAGSGRRPAKVIHDHGTHFLGQFERQLRVLGIERLRTITGLPSLNCYVENAIGFARRELLRYIRVTSAAELQRYLDEYREYANADRAHQSLGGQTPSDFSNAAPQAEVLELEDLRRRRLVRREYANGILRGYSLAEVNDSTPVVPEQRAA